MRPALMAVAHLVSARLLKLRIVVLLVAAALLFAPAGRAEDLHYFKNYFVTGDYAVDGVGLYAKGVNGWATGMITITAAEVPPGADIVAAYLYWETVETTTNPSSMNGYFDFDSNNKPYPIVGDVVGSPNTPPCWSQGGTGGPGTWLRVYRADVLRYLKVDKNGTVRDVDYTHTVTLPDSGINQPGIVPHTEGASLVVVYRVLDGKTPYKAVVMYDGAYTMPKGSTAFDQTLGGFYQAVGGAARMTQIVGNGQPGFAEKLTVNGSPVPGVSATPFVGVQSPRWDNLTFNINLAANASSVETQVMGETNQVCLSWGAVLMSTNVVNSDGDGILDTWKTNGLHLNVGSPATKTAASVPATFDGCAKYPKDPCENLAAMGAISGPTLKPPAVHKDVFVQIDWMQGYDGHIHSPKLAALQAIAGTFLAHQIYVHFDVGNRYQGFATAASNYMMVPSAVAQGGHLIQESSLECPNNMIANPADCEYNTQSLGYSVLGWKTGIGAIENGFPILNIAQNFAHDRKDIFHYMLLAHALAGPIDANTGLPVTPPPSVSGVGDLFGGDVMVTLGLWRTYNPVGCVQDDPTGNPNTNLCTDQTGTSLVQAGTLFHELGHNLGLHHGGGVDTPNCMVDYPSTMNYLYQTRGLTGGTGDISGVAMGIEHIDFSSGTLAGLNENSLLGTPNLGGLPYRLRYYGPATGAEIAAGSNAKANCNGTFPAVGTPSVRLETSDILNSGTIIDWSNGTGIGAPTVNHPYYSDDVDFDGTIGDSVAGGAGFIDHNDWAALNLQQIGGRPNVSGLSVNVGPADISTTDLLGQSVLGQNVLGQNVLGQNVLGQSVLGQNVLGQSVLGQNVLGQNVLGQNVLGQNVLGQNVLGEVDYETAISTLDATGADHPLVGGPSASGSAGTAYNQVSLTWGLPSLGLIRTYTIYRTNLSAANLVTVVAGSVSGAPPLTAFTDPVTDPNLSDIGANCPSGNVCYDTNYQYYVIATDTNNNSSTPSNLVTVTVDHLYVSGFTGGVVYGNPLPTSMAATISGLPSGGITSANFTCPTPAPRNVGSYPDICTGPAVGTPNTVGVSYLPGTLMITQRPLTITAGACTKTYDGTTNAPAAGTCAAAAVTGLAPAPWEGYTDTVSAIMEVYTNANVAGAGGSTLHVSSYTVNDQNGGGNYAPVTLVDTPGTINPAPLKVTVTGTQVYGGTGITYTPTYSGFVNGEGPSVFGNSTLSCTTSATNSSPVLGGPYRVTGCSGLIAANYKITYSLGAFTVTPAPLTVIATGIPKQYDGTTNAAVTLSDNRLFAADTFTDTYTTAMFISADVGTPIPTPVPINVAGIAFSGAGATNYVLTNAGGTASASAIISAYPLTVTATGVNKVYDGTTAATVTLGDNRPAAGTDPGDAYTSATFASPNVGTGIAVSVTGISVTSADYALQNTTANTTANITPALLIAAVTGASPNFSVSSYVGFQGSDTSSLVAGGTPTCSPSGPTDTAGNQPLACSGLAAPNYVIDYSYSVSPGVANPQQLTVSVSGTQPYGGTPTYTVTYFGFVGTDTLASAVTGTLSCTSAATSTSAVGSTPAITGCSGLNSTNYGIAYVLGTVTIMPAPLVAIVTPNQGGYTASYVGLLGSDSVSGTPSCTAGTADPAGNIPVSCSGLTPSQPYYNLIYSYPYAQPEQRSGDGTAPLTITVTGTAGTPPGIASLTYSGLVNGDLPANVAGAITSCTGTSPVTACTGLSAPINYTSPINFEGTLQ